MGETEVVFDAYLLANKPVIDIAFIQEATIKRDFIISVMNPTDYIIYPKLICNIPNWSFEGVSYKELAGIGAGAEKFYLLHFWRAKPTPEYNVDLVDSGNLKIELYNDSGYTDYYGGDSVSVDMRVVYLTAFPNVQQWSFYDGTNQGWTLEDMSMSNGRYFGGTQYAPRCYKSGAYFYTTLSCDCKISRAITLPNTNKVFGKVHPYLYAYFRVHHGGGAWISLKNLEVKFGEHSVLYLPLEPLFYSYSHVDWAEASLSLSFPGVSFDLSEYKGNTDTLSISALVEARSIELSYASTVTVEACLDLITIGGK